MGKTSVQSVMIRCWRSRFVPRIRSAMVVATILALAACSSFTGAPPYPANLTKEIEGLADEHSASKIVACIQKSASQQTDCRNRIIQSRMIVIDAQYTQFRQEFYGEARWGGFATTLAGLGLTTTAGLTGVAASTAKTLSAVATGLTGAKVAFQKDVLADRTATAIETAMDATRNKVALRIRAGLREDATKYPLAVALSDLEAYYNAGTMLGALVGITEIVGEQAEKTNRELAAGYVTVRGYNTTAAAACVRAKAFLPGQAGAANRRAIETAVGTTAWVPIINNPDSDPSRIAKAAAAVGCVNE